MGKQLPKQHEIDELACRLFAGKLPASWRVREQLKDYGVDAEVEIFDKGVSTGVIFKVQIKGTENPSFSANSSTISLKLSVDDVVYLCEELGIPTFLVVADVVKSRVWWHPIQLDSDLRQRLESAKKSKQVSLTIHLDPDRELPATVSALFSKVLESDTYLSARSVSEATPNTFLNAMACVTDLDDILAGLGRGLAFVRIEKLERLCKAGNYTEAEAVVKEVLQDTASTVEAKFAAFLYAEQLALHAIRMSDKLKDYSKVRLRFALGLESISKGGPLHLRSFAALTVRAAQLHQLVEHDFYLFMNAKVQQDPKNQPFMEPLWAMMLPAARKQAATLVTRKCEQCSRLLRFMAKKNLFHIIPRSVACVLMSMQAFLARLWDEGMTEAAKAYEKSLRSMAQIAVDLAVQLQNWNDASLVIMGTVWLCNPEDEQSVNAGIEWAENKAQQIEEVETRDDTAAEVKRAGESIRMFASEGPTEAMGLDAERQIYEGMAASVGIDLEDPKDEIAKIVRIGIRDLDPTRVLKNCRYLFVTMAGGGIPARMLALPTAGLKYLFCTRHGYGIGSLSLDAGYELFRVDHCAKCGDIMPHPVDWKWSHAWQKEQIELHGDRFKPV